MNVPIGPINQYIPNKKLGQGAFGEIYEAQDQNTKEVVALKIESSQIKHPQLKYEQQVYQNLSQTGLTKGIPKIYEFIVQQDKNIMVMELLGKSLEDLFCLCNRTFSLKTTILISLQILERIEFIQNKHFLHRDIKPDNFLIGKNDKKHLIYIVDFGLAKKYTTNNQHIPYKENKNLTGTARYTSINTHLGIEQGRRDDLESLGYMMVYFMKGHLPWQNLKTANKKEKVTNYEKIMEKKLGTSIESLCDKLPIEFYQYMAYCRKLKFDEKPDYEYLKNLLRKVQESQNIQNDNNYDWVGIQQQQQQEIQQHQQQQQNQQRIPYNQFSPQNPMWRNNDVVKKKQHYQNGHEYNNQIQQYQQYQQQQHQQRTQHVQPHQQPQHPPQHQQHQTQQMYFDPDNHNKINHNQQYFDYQNKYG